MLQTRHLSQADDLPVHKSNLRFLSFNFYLQKYYNCFLKLQKYSFLIDLYQEIAKKNI